MLYFYQMGWPSAKHYHVLHDSEFFFDQIVEKNILFSNNI